MPLHKSSVQVEELDGLNHLRIPAGQKYKSPGKIYVEGDASSASYWLAGISPALLSPRLNMQISILSFSCAAQYCVCGH